MDQGKVLLGFLAGVAIGGIAAVLLAPDKGENTRANILDSSGDFLRRFKKSYNGIIDNVTSALDTVVQNTEEVDEGEDLMPHHANYIGTDGKNQI